MPLLHPIAALSDNYVWALHDGACAWVVDPGAAEPVQNWLEQRGLRLEGILLTHHHDDHCGGVPALLAAHPDALAWGPPGEPLPAGVRRLSDGAALDVLGCTLRVLGVPGHTRGHVAYHGAEAVWCLEAAHAPAATEPAEAGLLLCGDTLFSIGCGRLFEGSPAQMLASLERLAALGDPCWVCCAHEYTLGNLRFALSLEPEHAGLAAYQRVCQVRRDSGLPTLPSTLERERELNPFLRSRTAALRRAIERWPGSGACAAAAAQTVSSGLPTDPDPDVAAFAALRRAKDGFR